MTGIDLPAARGDASALRTRPRSRGACQFPGSVKRHARTARNMQFAHVRPRTFAETLDRHRRVAAAHHAPVLRGSREAWGYIHLATFKPVCMFTEWITETPLIGFPALVAATVSVLLALHVI